MQLFSADTILFKKKMFLLIKSVKKKPSKAAKKILELIFFSLLPWAAQTAQTEECVFQNVAFRPTVYKTGAPN